MAARKLDLNTCANCRQEIKTSVFLGSGICSDRCRRAVFGSTPTTIILTDELLKARDDMLRAAWRKKPRTP